MALNGLVCVDVPLRNYSLTHASQKVLDFFFLKIPGPRKSLKITLVLESPGN